MDNVIDIVAVGRASLPLARWWRGFLADPEAAGEHLDELERARRHLRALGTVPGRLGQAVAVVVAGGGATVAESVEAIEFLTALADRAPAAEPTRLTSPPPPSGRNAAAARTGRRDLAQQTLPGM